MKVTETQKENYYLLITAIVLQAEKDYFSSVDSIRFSAIDFLLSEDFHYLTGIYGNAILEKLNRGEIHKPKDVLDKIHREYASANRTYKKPE